MYGELIMESAHHKVIFNFLLIPDATDEKSLYTKAIQVLTVFKGIIVLFCRFALLQSLVRRHHSHSMYSYYEFTISSWLV